LRAIAIADHDNIEGIAPAQAIGAKRGVEIVPGVELSVVWEKWRDLHLLGYAFDPLHPGSMWSWRSSARSDQPQRPDPGADQSEAGRRGRVLIPRRRCGNAPAAPLAGRTSVMRCSPPVMPAPWRRLSNAIWCRATAEALFPDR